MVKLCRIGAMGEYSVTLFAPQTRRMIEQPLALARLRGHLWPGYRTSACPFPRETSIDPAINYVESSPQRRRPRVGGDPASFVEKSLDPRLRGDDEISIFNCRINNNLRSTPASIMPSQALSLSKDTNVSY